MDDQRGIEGRTPPGVVRKEMKSAGPEGQNPRNGGCLWEQNISAGGEDSSDFTKEDNALIMAAQLMSGKNGKGSVAVASTGNMLRWLPSGRESHIEHVQKQNAPNSRMLFNGFLNRFKID